MALLLFSRGGALPVELLPEGMTVPDIVAKGLLAHNIKEYTNLAAILPRVYAEEKDNW